MATELIGAIVNDERRILPVSRVQDGACGIRGLALSLPALVGAGGAVQVLEPAMDDAERQGLAASATVLERAFATLAG